MGVVIMFITPFFMLFFEITAYRKHNTERDAAIYKINQYLCGDYLDESVFNGTNALITYYYAKTEKYLQHSRSYRWS